jgi:hypothetical protein
MTKKGIYYVLFKEFEEALSQPYSILPLVRPTRSDELLRARMSKEGKASDDAVRVLAKTLLSHKAGAIKEGQEFVSRDGCVRETLNSEGGLALTIPECVVTNSLTSLLRRNARCAGRVGSSGDLGLMTKKELLAVAVKEKNTAARPSMNKAQLIAAIKTAREGVTAIAAMPTTDPSLEEESRETVDVTSSELEAVGQRATIKRKRAIEPDELSALSKRELKELAGAEGVIITSNMSKDKLISVITTASRLAMTVS